VSSYVTRTKGNTAQWIIHLPYHTMNNLNQCAILRRLNPEIMISASNGNTDSRQYKTEKIRIFK
ncbi:MAG: hypothetical protein WCP55_17350, partial [Lentisphaerota bacterium]